MQYSVYVCLKERTAKCIGSDPFYSKSTLFMDAALNKISAYSVQEIGHFPV